MTLICFSFPISRAASCLNSIVYSDLDGCVTLVRRKLDPPMPVGLTPLGAGLFKGFFKLS
jgi:hypothetical protein